MNTATTIIDRFESIGSVPSAIAQVFGLINDPKATLADFERVVRPDVGLTTHLLRSANSAYYRASREITSVRDAIGRMGMRRVFELAASTSFSKTVPEVLAGYGTTSMSYWQHSVTVAVLSDRIGREVGFTYPDLAFTAGLLHDLGKVVVSNWVSTNPAVQVPEGGLDSLDREREVLGATHAELGEALCLKWNLPKDIAGAARWHHDPASAPSATLRYLSTVVHVADAAARLAGFGEGGGAQEPEAEALERLALTPEQVSELVEGAKAEIMRTQDLLARAA